MKTTYIQFEFSASENISSKDGHIMRTFKNVLFGILTRIIPKANPDFDSQIDKVNLWLIECDTETGIPQREIGIDNKGNVILKMPYKDNYGFWTDNILLLADFKENFAVTEISQESFENSWNIFPKHEK